MRLSSNNSESKVMTPTGSVKEGSQRAWKIKKMLPLQCLLFPPEQGWKKT